MNSEKGFTILEVVIAFSALAIIITAVSIAVTTSLSNSLRSKNQNLASEYAQQGMEVMRHMRDINYSTFSGLSLDYCLDQSCTILNSNNSKCWKISPLPASSCGQNTGNFFVRDVYVTQNSANPDCNNQSTEVKVTVSWADGLCKDPANQYCEHIPVVSCFSNPNANPAP